MDKLQKHVDVCSDIRRIYALKNADYGDSFGKSLDEFGPIAFVVRASDKMERLKQLVKSEAKVKGESFDDTVSDLANYCIMYLMESKR